jgi:2-polyprenyl-3-methyl-5-hydroxy-6-metoxy-1,4-benzoquinol methylase
MTTPAARPLRDILYESYVSRFKGAAAPVATALTASQETVLARLLRPLVASLPRDARILDIGCGSGGLLQYLGKLGFTAATGIDVSAEQVAIAARRGVKAEVGDLFDVLERSPDTFDGVIAIDLIEHLTKQELSRFGTLLHAALRPGGIVLLQTPNGEGVGCGHIVYGDLTHETIFNESSLNQFFAAFGFREIAVRETGPVPRNVSGVFRTIVWKLIRLAAQVGAFAQAGRWPRILTATIVATARKP